MSLEAALETLGVDLVERLADAFVEAAQARCSRRTGNLADSITRDAAVWDGKSATCRVSVGEDYAQYQDEGTGVYGPEGTPIIGTGGKNHNLLAFDWPAAGGLVIVHSVEGAPGTHFWSDTIADWGGIVSSV